MVDWKLVLCNNGLEPIGDILNFREMKLFRGLSKVSTLSFSVRLDNPLAQNLAECRDHVQAYRNKQLMLWGNELTVQEVGNGDDATLKVNIVGPEWKFTKLLIAQNVEYTKFAPGTNLGEAIAKEVKEVKPVNGLYVYAPLAKCKLEKTITQEFKVRYKYLSEFIEECYDAYGGFDWVVEPRLQSETEEQGIAELIIKDVIGEARPNAAFQWGGGRRNVANYTHTIDRTTLINRAINFPPSGPTSTNRIIVEDTESGIIRYGLNEELIQSDILSKTLREGLVKENIEVRKVPRKTVTFEPIPDDGSGRVPVFGADFNLGDTVPVLISYNGSIRLNAEVRVWGVEFLVDENLKEVQKLTLSNS